VKKEGGTSVRIKKGEERSKVMGKGVRGEGQLGSSPGGRVGGEVSWDSEAGKKSKGGDAGGALAFFLNIRGLKGGGVIPHKKKGRRILGRIESITGGVQGKVLRKGIKKASARRYPHGKGGGKLILSKAEGGDGPGRGGPIGGDRHFVI